MNIHSLNFYLVTDIFMSMLKCIHINLYMNMYSKWSLENIDQRVFSHYICIYHSTIHIYIFTLWVSQIENRIIVAYGAAVTLFGAPKFKLNR